MINYLIVDDEPIAHDIIKDYCDMLPNMHFSKSCFDALEAIEFLSFNKVDLIFLDLNMPKLKGFEFLKTLSNPPKVIVTTAYREFAIEGYELNVSDYLLKPFSFERFLKAINKTLSHPNLPRPISTSHSDKTNRIFLRSDKKYIQIEIDLILFIEASGNYTKIYTTTESITIRDKVSNVIELLPQDDFVQVHKSFAVGIKHIKSIEGNRIFIGEHTVPIGKMYKVNVNELIK